MSQLSQHPHRKPFRFGRNILLFSGLASAFVGLGGLQYAEQGYRVANTIKTGAVVTADYYFSLHWKDDKDPNYSKEKSAVHRRCAQRILRLCKTHGGVFVKASQFISSLRPMVPAEYTDVLSELQDKAKPRDFAQIRRVVQTELSQAHLEDLFSEFDQEPIGAASLAQVHRARLRKTNEEVAVKVQYPNLQHVYRSDIWAIDLIFRAIRKQFPEVNFVWAVNEFQNNIESELDFIHEGKNAERCARNFSEHSQLKVPSIIWPLTTKRLLTMEFVHGVKIDNVVEIEKMNFDKTDVASLLIDLFSEMIFVHGFIHADPHPGNILVRKNLKTLKPELILLDHGLYREIDDLFRVRFCKFWRALVFRDEKNVEKYARELGAGDLHNLFAFLLTFRSSKDKTIGISGPTTAAQVDAVRAEFGHMRDWRKSAADVTSLLEGLDRQLLLILKTIQLMRSNNYALGSIVNRFLAMAKYATIGVYNETTPIWYRKILIRRDLLYYDVIYATYRVAKFAREKYHKVLAWLGLREAEVYLQPLEAHKRATDRQSRFQAAKNA